VYSVCVFSFERVRSNGSNVPTRFMRFVMNFAARFFAKVRRDNIRARRRCRGKETENRVRLSYPVRKKIFQRRARVSSLPALSFLFSGLENKRNVYVNKKYTWPSSAAKRCVGCFVFLFELSAAQVNEKL